MKGVIFNLFEEFIVTTFGDEAWEAILDQAPHDVRTVRVGPASYPDEHLFAIVGSACKHAGLPVDQAVRAFGKFLFGGLTRKYPHVAAQFTDPRSLLHGIDSVIHVEVNKLLPGAQTPRITCVDEADGTIVLTYDSKRQLCGLLEGLLDGMEEHFRVTVHRTHDVCQQRGAASCELRLRIEARSAAA